MIKATAVFLGFGLAAAAVPALAEQAFDTSAGRVRLETVAAGLDHPWSLAFLPDGAMLVTERPGTVRIVGPDGSLSAPLPGAPATQDWGQGGMLDIVLDPNFAANGMIYLSFAEIEGGKAGTAVARARLVREGGPPRLEDTQVIFRMTGKTGSTRHFGSRFVFAPDGMLFVTLGDRGDMERAQDTADHAGSVIRIAPDGTVPADNPFVDGGGLPEIWSIGHRNLQGAAINPATGVLWTVEHGARGGDEINIPRAGRNYGWPVISYGRHYSGGKIGIGTAKEGMEQPVHYWDPSIAPSGMAFYTGDRFPAWTGDVFVGALRGAHVARLALDGDSVAAEETLFDELGERIRDIRQGPDGYLYLVTDSGDGRILRVVPAE
ncbi:PQQ-dependent sugar dehydrogenase [Microbaculum sp. A6E488]|uniref:PQQ-dependent sugar dehydrogenase n=2 Tax=Microbaculum marinisediminis TaxID=2931392 RepID=A0AAW5R634_9HYPH|nr:PQQ-dependent sugar dehydrogenase [Microbaculum sp. A6E488]MCT8974872.1 PQQ-dependent sugar dehydrogenase [Microbaculum sp. A6E488]